MNNGESKNNIKSIFGDEYGTKTFAGCVGPPRIDAPEGLGRLGVVGAAM